MIFPSVQFTNTGIQMHTFSNCVNGAIEQQTFAQSFIQVYYLASNTSCVYLYLYLSGSSHKQHWQHLPRPQILSSVQL